MAEEENGFDVRLESTTGSGSLPEYTLEQVALHNTKESLWLVIDGKVYDVTNFQESHPGTARPLLNNAGQDATEGFVSIGHSPAAIETREGFLIGKVAKKSTDASAASGDTVKPLVSETSEGREPQTTSTGQQTGESEPPRSNACGFCGISSLTAIGVSVVVVAIAAVVVYKLRSR